MNLFKRVCSPLLRSIPKIASPRFVALSLLASHLVFHPIKLHSSAKPENKSDFKKYDSFTDELYQSLHQSHDIIIIVDPDRFAEHFLDELLQVVEQVGRVQKARSKRPLKILCINEPIDDKLVKKFQEKYKITLEYDTILLLKNKYIPKIYNFNANDYFDNRIMLLNYFKKINKINSKKLQEFEQILSYLPSTETAVLVYADKNSTQYRNIQTRFCIMQQSDTYQKNEKLHWILIDKAVSEKLGLSEVQDGSLYFLQKSSKLNGFKKSIEVNNKKLLVTYAGTLGGKSVENVMDQLAETYNDVNVFSNRSFGKPSTKYSIVLELDLNKIPKHEETRLIKAFGELKRHLKDNEPEVLKKTEFVYLNKTPKDNQIGYQVYIRDDQKYGDRLRQHSETDLEVMKSLSVFNDFGEAHSYIYRLQEDIQVGKDSLISFFQGVRNGYAKEYFQTQDIPKYKKYSVKLVGQTFEKEVMQSNKDYAIFQYSKNCHACGEYGQYYENLALESLKINSPMNFGRMNNDHNKPSCIQDFPYTPVFMVCKNGTKDKPYIYRYDIRIIRNQKFTPELLKSFFTVTNSFSIIPEEQYQKLMQDRINYVNYQQ